MVINCLLADRLNLNRICLTSSKYCQISCIYLDNATWVFVVDKETKEKFVLNERGIPVRKKKTDDSCCEGQSDTEIEINEMRDCGCKHKGVAKHHSLNKRFAEYVVAFYAVRII